MAHLTEEERQAYKEKQQHYTEVYDRYLKLSLHDRIITKMILSYENNGFLEYILSRENMFIASYSGDKERLYACMSFNARKFIKRLRKENTK